MNKSKLNKLGFNQLNGLVFCYKNKNLEGDAESLNLEEAENKLRATVKEYQERLFDVRGESVVLNEQLKSRKQQLSELTERVARLKAKLASVEKQSVQISQSQAREKEQLQLVLQVLS